MHHPSFPRRRPRRPFSLTALTFVALALFVLLPPSAAHAADGSQQLALQAQQDLTMPLARSTWIGTHNSYNSKRWGYDWDPNQQRTLTEQLDEGARQLVFDIHYYAGRMILCHGASDHSGCTGSDKKLRQGLEKIRQWLRDGHRDEVILLKVELAIAGHHSKLENHLEAELGDYLYRPDNDGIDLDAENGKGEGCQGLPINLVSKEDVLAAGKNVIVVQTDPDKNCTGDYGLDSAMYSGVWTGFRDLSDVAGNPYGYYEDKFEKPSGVNDCTQSAALNTVEFVRLFDPNTWFNYAGTGSPKITKSNVRDYFACGLNVFELYNFNNQSSRSGVKDGLQAKDLVWGWNGQEPDRGTSENCAFLVDGGYRDLPCYFELPYTCVSHRRQWKVTSASGSWDGGYAACPEEYGQAYRFAVPQNYFDLLQLIDQADIGSEWIWVNYHDLAHEGVWQSDIEPTGLWKTSEYGGSGGSAFDDLHFLGLQRQWTTNVRRLYLRSNTRINKIGVEYNNGHVVEHGGNGGSYAQMWMGAGEYLKKVKVCIARKDGKDRVFYLRFVTNYDNTLAGGEAKGNCQEWDHGSHAVIGFFGRSNDHLQAIGFYNRDISDHYGWNHGEPNGWGNENCARFNHGVLVDYPCTRHLRYSCRLGNGQWAITHAAGPWDEGEAKCTTQFGSNAFFSAPRTRKEAEHLQTAAGSHYLWVHYSDHVNEGTWRFGN